MKLKQAVTFLGEAREILEAADIPLNREAIEFIFDGLQEEEFNNWFDIRKAAKTACALYIEEMEENKERSYWLNRIVEENKQKINKVKIEQTA